MTWESESPSVPHQTASLETMTAREAGTMQAQKSRQAHRRVEAEGRGRGTEVSLGNRQVQ